MLTWLLHSRVARFVVRAFTTSSVSTPPPPATLWPGALRVLSLSTDDDELVTAMNTVSKALKTWCGKTHMRNAQLLFNNPDAVRKIIALVSGSSKSSSAPTATATSTATRAVQLVCQLAEEGVIAVKLLREYPECAQAILAQLSREDCDNDSTLWTALVHFASHDQARRVLFEQHAEAIVLSAKDALKRATDPFSQSLRDVPWLISYLAPRNKAAEELRPILTMHEALRKLTAATTNVEIVTGLEAISFALSQDFIKQDGSNKTVHMVFAKLGTVGRVIDLVEHSKDSSVVGEACRVLSWLGAHGQQHHAAQILEEHPNLVRTILDKIGDRGGGARAANFNLYLWGGLGSFVRYAPLRAMLLQAHPRLVPLVLKEVERATLHVHGVISHLVQDEATATSMLTWRRGSAKPLLSWLAKGMGDAFCRTSFDICFHLALHASTRPVLLADSALMAKLTLLAAHTDYIYYSIFSIQALSILYGESEGGKLSTLQPSKITLTSIMYYALNPVCQHDGAELRRLQVALRYLAIVKRNRNMFWIWHDLVPRAVAEVNKAISDKDAGAAETLVCFMSLFSFDVEPRAWMQANQQVFLGVVAKLDEEKHTFGGAHRAAQGWMEKLR